MNLNSSNNTSKKNMHQCHHVVMMPRLKRLSMSKLKRVSMFMTSQIKRKIILMSMVSQSKRNLQQIQNSWFSWLNGKNNKKRTYLLP